MLDRGYSNFQKTLFLAGYIVSINISYIVSYYIANVDYELFDSKNTFYLIFSNIIWSMLARAYSLYRHQKTKSVFMSFIQAYAIQALMSFVFIAILKIPELFVQVIYMYIIFMILCFIAYYSVELFIKQSYKSGKDIRKFVMVGLNATSAEFVKTFREDKEARLEFLGYFDDIVGVVNKNLIKGDLNQIKDFLLTNRVDDVFCSVQKLSSEKIVDLINFCDNNMIRIHFLPEFFNYMSKRSVRFQMEYANNLPILSIRREPLENFTNQIIKRAFDIVFSSVVILLLLSWIIPVLGLLIKLESKGPIFFIQKRSGKNNVPFKMIKFRSMTPNEEADTKQAIKGDMRITKIGAFIRKTSIDEMPNFINVFIGKMTVVGPRPHMLNHTKEYGEIIDKFMVRQFGKPGITGLAQVSGYRGETTDPVKMLKRVEKDVLYLEKWSFGLDIEIIFKTFWQVLTKPAE